MGHMRSMRYEFYNLVKKKKKNIYRKLTENTAVHMEPKQSTQEVGPPEIEKRRSLYCSWRLKKILLLNTLSKSSIMLYKHQ